MNVQFERLEDVPLDAAVLSLTSGDGISECAALTLEGMMSGPQLPHLLSTLLPPTCRLASLTLGNCRVAAEVPCPSLSTLTSLNLDSCECDGDAATLADLAWQAPGLCSLTISYIPPVAAVDLSAITQLFCLTRLELHGLYRDDLLPGPYLEGGWSFRVAV